MWRTLTIVALTAIVVAAGLFWIITEPVTVSALPAYVADATRGRTVFNAGGCSSCHASVDQDDRTVLGGGVAIPSPFGTFYAPNISQNPVDGIGRWTEVNFVTAMLKGTSPAGQPTALVVILLGEHPPGPGFEPRNARRQKCRIG